ncbi:MAG: hypothetical protein A2Y97_05985 [Nitrospirae bacterium RBG_13_39_12]|nr:MAG: hypothetical protein A2Y97_05985 [Nitrospirae bacterium RBG_13_39_12]
MFYNSGFKEITILDLNFFRYTKYMKCKQCNGEIRLILGCRSVTLNCLKCGTTFPLKDYIDEMDDEMWEQILLRPCNRV